MMNITQESIEKVEAKERELWEKLMQVEKETEPAIKRRDDARREWHTVHEEAKMMVKILELNNRHE